MAKQNLTDKQQLFVKEYLVDLNATQAAIRAGYSEKTSGRIGQENLQKPVIAAAIAGAMENRSKRVEADADYVLHRLVEIDQMDVIDILNDDGSLKAVKDWPKIWRQFISSFDVSEVYEGFGDERELAGFMKKIKWPDKVKNLELIGKHVNVQAFKDKAEVEHKVSDLERLLQEIDGTTLGPPSMRNKGVSDG